jgi:hypothetical protein
VLFSVHISFFGCKVLVNVLEYVDIKLKLYCLGTGDFNCPSTTRLTARC